MTWPSQWRARWSGVRRAATSQIDKNIDDELMFHFRSQIDEHLSRGMSPDAAWQEAQARFGSPRHYADACRRETLRQRFSMQKIAFGLLATLLLLVGWLAWEVRGLHSARNARGDDLTGTVLDRQSQPVSGATVLVVLKTWPGGWFRQDAFATRTDAYGRFRLAGLLPLEGQYAVQVAAVGSGYALTSSYHLTKAQAESRPNRVSLQLDDATLITLVVNDADGRPIANARIVPVSRRSIAGVTHLVYFQGSEPIQIAANDQGEADLGYFERGDEAEIYVQPPGEEWIRRTIAIPQAGNRVVVSTEAGDDPQDRGSLNAST